MDFPRVHTLVEVATLLNCEYDGTDDHQVWGWNEIHRVRPGDLVFVDHPKYYDKALDSAATTILINKKVAVPRGKGILISDDPFRDFNKLKQYFLPFKANENAIHPTATIGTGTIIQPGCFIGPLVEIGENCVIHSNVSIYDRCKIGNDVIIHANSVLGSDAFYYKNRETGFDKLLSSGTVVLEDKVHLGASCTIDRGVSADTRIGEGTVIDNSVHIGHDTLIGKRCLLAAQVGIAGCVVIEDDVTIWGQVGVSSNVRIGSKAIILAQSGVAKSVAGGKTYFGYPADEARKRFREMASVRILPKIIEQLTITE
jgi:UDP-3-O-[3-hydroxymyristoyl] glucosamine N-acyltransferase